MSNSDWTTWRFLDLKVQKWDGYRNPRRWWSREKVRIWLSDQWYIGCGARIEQKTPAKMDGKMLGLNPSKSNRFQIGQARYPRPKGRASLQSDMEVQIHAFTRIGTVTASRMLVWKNHPNNSVQYQKWQRCQEMSTREFRAYRGISKPRVNQKSGPSQGPRGKWKDIIIVSA